MDTQNICKAVYIALNVYALLDKLQKNGQPRTSNRSPLSVIVGLACIFGFYKFMEAAGIFYTAKWCYLFFIGQMTVAVIDQLTPINPEGRHNFKQVFVVTLAINVLYYFGGFFHFN